MTTVERACELNEIGNPSKRISLGWSYLALAVASEVIGLTALKISVNWGRSEGYIVLYVLIAFSYWFLAKALKHISVAVAYAIWEGAGISIITIVSVFVFAHALTWREAIGIAMAITGILLVNAGEIGPEENGMTPRFTKESTHVAS